MRKASREMDAAFAPEYLYDISTALDPYGPNEPTPQVTAEP